MADDKKTKFDWAKRIKEGAAIGLGAVGGLALKDALTKTTYPSWGEIMAERALANQKAAASAARSAAVKGALGAKVGAAASIGIPLAAGALGGLAIWNTKKKFDKEIDQYTTDSNKRHEELIKAIRDQRDRKKELKNLNTQTYGQ